MNRIAAVLLMALFGAFLSAQAPSVYSLATLKFSERAVVAVPLVDAIGNLGGFPGPMVLGILADRLGSLEGAIWVAPALGSLLPLIAFGWELGDRLSARGPRVAPAPPS